MPLESRVSFLLVSAFMSILCGFLREHRHDLQPGEFDVEDTAMLLWIKGKGPQTGRGVVAHF